MSYLPIGPNTKAFAVPVQLASDHEALVTLTEVYPSAPVMTLYSPATTAYVKVTPDPTALMMRAAPVVTTETLQYCSILTHKIADTTTITSDDATSDATDRLRATEFKNDCNVHMASTAYHGLAGPAITAADATDDPTLIALCQEIDLDLKAHAASTTQHGGRADAVFAAALAALALPAVPTKAQCRLYLVDTALKAAWDAHLAVTDNSIYATHGAAVMPLEWPCLGAFYCKTNVSAHTFTTMEFLST
jgi:hypothetical protein